MFPLLCMTALLAATPEMAPKNRANPSRGLIAMMPLSSLGSTDQSVQAIERVLVGELSNLLGEKLVPPSQIDKQPAHIKRALTVCDGSLDCLVEIFGGLGWDGLLVGTIAGLANDRVINLKLVDLRTGHEAKQVSEAASGTENELIVNMRKAAVQLVAPELYTGTLQIHATQPNIEISVDGERVGSTPLVDPNIAVPVGRRAVEANGPGLVPFSTMIEIAYGEKKPLTILLPDNTVFVGGTTPYYARWWTWALAGAGIAAVGLGGYFNKLQHDNVSRIEKRAANTRLTAEDTDLYKDSKNNWTRALIFYGAGGAMLGTVGAFVVFDFL